MTVVHVTSPNALHFDQVTTLLNAGKHVICEKPLALTASEGESLLKLAESKNLVHALCFNTRFYPMVHEARSLVNNGKIGSPTYVKGSYHQDWLLLDTDWNWRLEGEKAGELRAIADIGSHLIDQISFVVPRCPIQSFSGSTESYASADCVPEISQERLFFLPALT